MRGWNTVVSRSIRLARLRCGALKWIYVTACGRVKSVRLVALTGKVFQRFRNLHRLTWAENSTRNKEEGFNVPNSCKIMFRVASKLEESVWINIRIETGESLCSKMNFNRFAKGFFKVTSLSRKVSSAWTLSGTRQGILVFYRTEFRYVRVTCQEFKWAER